MNFKHCVSYDHTAHQTEITLILNIVSTNLEAFDHGAHRVTIDGYVAVWLKEAFTDCALA
jgi:hypothetical protein